jgi:hypothetical protein
MFLFGKKKKLAKDPNSKQYKWQMAEMVSGKHLRYVVERWENDEKVIGRNGSIGVKDDSLIVNTDTGIAFRGKVEEIVVSELLSKDGVVITGYDTERNVERTVVAFYVYYR